MESYGSSVKFIEDQITRITPCVIPPTSKVITPCVWDSGAMPTRAGSLVKISQLFHVWQQCWSLHSEVMKSWCKQQAQQKLEEKKTGCDELITALKEKRL